MCQLYNCVWITRIEIANGCDEDEYTWLNCSEKGAAAESSRSFQVEYPLGAALLKASLSKRCRFIPLDVDEFSRFYCM